MVGAGVLDGGNFLVQLVGSDRLGSDLVEGLDVDETADQAFFMELDHMGGDAAEGEGRFDPLLDHALADIFDRREGGAARSGLD